MSLRSSIPEPGDVIAGKYQVVAVLGAADAGIVFQAELAGGDEMVALHWYASGPAGRHASALTEARLTALAHLPQRCGFRVLETLDTRDAHYLVTTWQAGESLEARLTRVGPQPIAEVSRLLLPCIRAAHTAYLAAIVRHPIKATTIYVCDGTAERPEHAKLLDFELDPDRALQPTASDADPLSRSARLTEAQRAQRADPRTAVRAFGAIMYRALTGRRHPLFDDPLQLSDTSRTAPPPLLPPIVRWFLERAVSDTCKEPFNTLEDMAEALESMAAALPEVSVRVHAPMTPISSEDASPVLSAHPIVLLPTSFGANGASRSNLPSPVIRPWVTTMRLPRAVYPEPKAAPTRLPLAWIIAAVALVVTAGGLALRRDPRTQATEEEVVAYNAATALDAPPPSAVPKPMPRAPFDNQDLAVPPVVMPTPTATTPQVLQPMPRGPSPLKTSTLTPAIRPAPPPAAREPVRSSPRQRARTSAVPQQRSAARPSARPVPASERGVRTPARTRNSAPKERELILPSVPPVRPAVRQTAESGALDSMGLL